MKSLRKHLMPLQRRGLITIWSDTDIDAGTAWEDEIKKHLNSAQIILLLISPDFMASDYCYSTEMEQALQRNAQNEARVIPIILRPTAWKGAPFDKLQMLPSNAKPVTDRRSWQNEDEALNDVIEHIDPIVIELLLPLYIDEAGEHLKKGHRADALTVYERALRLEPQYVAALYGKGAALFLLDRYEESLAAYDKAIEASIDNSDNVDARFYYGKASALRKLERYDESLQVYDESIRINPHKIRTYKDKVELLLQLERYPVALEVYQQLINVDSENAAAYYIQTGDVLLKLRRYPQALEAYDKAIQLDPDETLDRRLYHKKGELLLKLGKFEEAVAAYEQAIILDPQIALYHINRGKALLELKRFEDALAAYEIGIKLGADTDPYVFYALGQILFGLEQYDDAIAAYDKAISLYGENPDPQFYHSKGVAYEWLAARAYKMEEQVLSQWHGKEKLKVSVVVPIQLEEFTLLQTSRRQLNIIRDIAIISGDQLLIAIVEDDAIKIRNPLSGQNHFTLVISSKKVYCVAASHDGQLLAHSDGDHKIKVWNPHTGEEFNTLYNHSGPAWSIIISPDNQLLISVNNDNAIKVWDLITGQELGNLAGHSNTINTLAISPNGQLLASGSADNTIKVWNLHKGKLLHTLNGHSSEVSSLAISPNGQLLYSGSIDNTIKVWNLSTGQFLNTLTEYSDALYDVTISSNGQILASAVGDKTIRLWDLLTVRELRTLRTETSTPAVKILFSPDGQFLVSNQEDTISVWGKK